MVGSHVCSDPLTLMASRSYAASRPERRDSGRRLLRLGVCVKGPRGRVNRAALSRSTIGDRTVKSPAGVWPAWQQAKLALPSSDGVSRSSPPHDEHHHAQACEAGQRWHREFGCPRTEYELEQRNWISQALLQRS